MRNAFAEIITEEAKKNDKVILLSGDIGNRLFDNFKKFDSKRFYNCGIAEAGMAGIASGLASCGYFPITYTITPFNTLRCLEQIRDDICYPNLPVIIVGTGSGLSYSNLGVTHHSLEDIALMRSLPNMNVICPADPIEVKLAVSSALNLKKPTYIRLGKKGEPNIHKSIPAFKIGKSINIKHGNEIAIISVGNVLSLAKECSKILEKKNISASIESFHTVKPLDTECLKKIYSEFKYIAILEEHSKYGGAGSAILEWGSINNYDTRKVILFGTEDTFYSALGNQAQAREKVGLTAENITNSLMKKISLSLAA